MIKNRVWGLIFIIVIAFASKVHGQVGDSPAPFYTYYYDYKNANPAFTGTVAKHVINTVYSSFPVNSFRNPSRLFYGSYEQNIESIKSGVGGLFMYDKIGSKSNIRGGLLYRRQLPFNETSGLRLGTQVFYQRWKDDFSSSYHYIMPQDVDPIIADSDTMKTKRTNFNLDLGAVYYSSYVTIGAGVKNVLKQGMESAALNVILTREFKIIDGLKANPSIFFLTDFDDNRFDINGTFEIREWVLLGAGYRFAESGLDDFTFNAGLNIKGWVQVIAHAYSSANERSRGNSETRIETMVRVTIPGGNSQE